MRLGDLGQLYDAVSDNWCGTDVASVSDILDFIKDSPIIDPETLSVVRVIREELERIRAERDEITNLCGKLVVICDQPRDKWKEVFQKYNLSMFGDYMGSGYPFVDAFNRIIADFMLTMSDGTYKSVMEAANKEIQNKTFGGSER